MAAGMQARNVPAKTTSVVILMLYARVGFGSDATTVRQRLAMTALDPPASACAANNVAVPGANRKPSRPTRRGDERDGDRVATIDARDPLRRAQRDQQSGQRAGRDQKSHLDFVERMEVG